MVTTLVPLNSFVNFFIAQRTVTWSTLSSLSSKHKASGDGEGGRLTDVNLSILDTLINLSLAVAQKTWFREISTILCNYSVHALTVHSTLELYILQCVKRIL